MPPCSVSGCTSGRKGFEKVQTFRYPSDDVMKKKWLKLIGRTTVGKDAVVCKKHFPLGYLKQKPKHPFASLSPNRMQSQLCLTLDPHQNHSKGKEEVKQKWILISKPGRIFQRNLEKMNSTNTATVTSSQSYQMKIHTR